VVKPTLQTTRDERIDAMDDCAYLVLPGKTRRGRPLEDFARMAIGQVNQVVRP
jgi:hypothetical protein